MSCISAKKSFLVEYHIPHTNNRLLLVFFVQVEVNSLGANNNKIIKKSDL